MAEYNRGEDASPEPQAASRCLYFTLGQHLIGIETAGAACSPRAFRIDWPTGPWTYRVWQQRGVIRRFPTPAMIVDIGPETSGIGQDMREHLRVEEDGVKRLLHNTNDQAVWVEATVLQGGVPSRLCWVLPARTRKIFAVVYEGDPEPALDITLGEREHV